MKRFLSLLMLVMVWLTSTTLAQAEPLRERLNAPATCQTEASSPSGKTHVIVDATVEVPDVDAVPIYEVYSRYFEPEELADLCRYLFGDQYTYTYSSSGGDYTTRPTASGLTFYLLRAEGWNPIHYRFQQGREGKPCSVDASCMELDAFPFAYESTDLRYYADPGYNMGSAYPAAEDALAMANELVTRLYPDFQFQHLGGEPMGYTFVGNRNGRVIGGEELYDTGYRVYYARMVDGIPLAQVDNVVQEYLGESLHSTATTRALPYESLFVDVGENGLYQFRYMNPVQIGEKLQADCMLLPFDQIMEIYLDFRRAVTGRWFPAAFFASALTMWLSIGSRSWYLFDMIADMEASDWFDLLQSTLSGELALLLLPALSALPYGAQALRELRSGAFRMAIFRSGRRAYIAGHALVCLVSGMLVQLCAMLLLAGFLTAATLAAGGLSLPLASLLELSPLILGRMLCGGGWALIGCSAALLTDTPSAAMIAPLCLCYALTMIATRFFPQATMLDPVRWQHAPLVTLLAAALLMLLGTGATLHREVQKHV